MLGLIRSKTALHKYLHAQRKIQGHCAVPYNSSYSAATHSWACLSLLPANEGKQLLFAVFNINSRLARRTASLKHMLWLAERVNDRLPSGWTCLLGLTNCLALHASTGITTAPIASYRQQLSLAWDIALNSIRLACIPASSSAILLFSLGPSTKQQTSLCCMTC